jgi:hypothetical protein
MALSIVTLGLIFIPGAIGVASAGAAPSTTLCSGNLGPGTYGSLVVPANQTCNLGVGPVTVHGGVRIEAGATFILGFEGGPATGTINGGVTAVDAATVDIHNARINGGVSLQGGDNASGSQCTAPYGGLCANDLEDNSINGGATINGYDGFYLGFIRNRVNGTTVISNTTVPDETDVGSNIVHGDLLCFGNIPLENTGGSPPATPDTVTGSDTCHEVA